MMTLWLENTWICNTSQTFVEHWQILQLAKTTWSTHKIYTTYLVQFTLHTQFDDGTIWKDCVWNAVIGSLTLVLRNFAKNLEGWLDTSMANVATEMVQAKVTDSWVFLSLVLYCTYCLILYLLPSVLSCCWLGGRKGIRPVKNWVMGCWRGDLSGARCRLAYVPADATATHCLLLQ